MTDKAGVLYITQYPSGNFQLDPSASKAVVGALAGQEVCMRFATNWVIVYYYPSGKCGSFVEDS